MRRLIGLTVALIMVGFLTMMTALPASAQLGDPLTVAASGVLLPFFNDPAAGFISVLELVTPSAPILSPTNPPVAAVNPIHGIFYNATCARQQSFPLIETEKQAVALNANAPPISLSFNGLAAIAQTQDQQTLIPLRFPLWSRTHWIDVKTGRLRELEPITLDQAYFVIGSTGIIPGTLGVTVGISGLSPWPVGLTSNVTPTFGGQAVAPNGPQGPFVWNPMRSGAMFVTPQEGIGVTASLVLICPRSSIQNSSTASTTVTAFRRFLFPSIQNRDGSFGFIGSNVITGASASTLRALVYDGDETPRRDLTFTCDCLSQIPVASLDPIYATKPIVVPAVGAAGVPVWYTELLEVASTSNPVTPNTQEWSFTGYWDLDVAGQPTTLFHRFSNASLDMLQPCAPSAAGTLCIPGQSSGGANFYADR